MSDTVAPTGVAVPATETKPKQARSPLNQAHARKLTKAEAVGLAAQNTAYAPALTKREIDETFVTQFLGDVEDTAYSMRTASAYMVNRPSSPM